MSFVRLSNIRRERIEVFFSYNTAAQHLIIVIDFYIIVSAFITGM